MKLDADTLRAEAEAHRVRMESPLWSRDDGKSDEHWTAPLRTNAHVDAQAPSDSPSSMSDSVHRSKAKHRERFDDGASMDLLPRLEALDASVEKLTAAMSRRPVGSVGVPGWLESAAGNPHTYDAPDSERTGVCVRVLPTTYAQLQQTQRRMGLRTIAGAWEFLLRLGLAAAERLSADRPP